MLIFNYRSLKIHQKEIKILEKMILETAESIPYLMKSSDLIKSMPGLQQLSKITMLVELGNGTRFPTAGDVAVYSGIAPREGTLGIANQQIKKEKVVKKDWPNRKCNRMLKRLFIRKAAVFHRINEKHRKTDDICRYAGHLQDQNILYFKKVFKIAGKWIRKLYHCLIHQVYYNPLVGLEITPQKIRKSNLQITEK